jgi:CMP-N-acetylneuraminic acid synthetase
MKKLIYGIIPARGGSKSIRNKNMHLLGGKPLIFYTINQALKSKIFDKIIVSTDSNTIIDYSKKFKGISVIKRPKNISGDKSPTIDALLHACNVLYKEKGVYPHIVLTIEPTSPFRKVSTIKKSINLLKKNKKIDSIMSVKKTKEVFVNIKKNLVILSKKARRRQDRDFLFIETGTLWATKYDVLKKKKSILGKNCLPIFVDQIESIDINEKKDLELASIIIKNKYK